MGNQDKVGASFDNSIAGVTRSRTAGESGERSRPRWGGLARLAAFFGMAVAAAQGLAAVPQVTANFGSGITTTVAASNHTTITFTLITLAGDPAATNVNFVETLPTSLRVAPTPNKAGTCANAVAATTAVAGAATITVANLQVPVGPGTCTVLVDVVNVAGALNGSCVSNPPAFTTLPANFTTFSNVTVNPATSSCITVGTWPALETPADRFGTSLNCTSNDVGLGNVNVVGTTQCIFGQPVTLQLTGDIGVTANTRWDIAFFFSQDNGSLLVQSTTPGGAQSSSVAILHAADLGGIIVNDDGDACMDGVAGSRLGITLPPITLNCIPNPTTGIVDLIGLVAWRNSAGNDCGGEQDVTVQTKAKCTFRSAPSGVAALGQINITKVTVPSPDPNATTFNFSAPNTTIFVDPNFVPTPNPFGLTDGQTQQLQTQPLTAAGTAYVITETKDPGYTLSNIFCTDGAGLPTPGQGTGPSFVVINIAAGTVTPTMSAVNGILNCTFVNTLLPLTTTVTKAWVNAVNGDTATLSISGAQISNEVDGSSTAPSTTTDSTAVVVAGSTVNVAEVLGAGNLGAYTTTLACVSNGQPVTVVANSFTMPSKSVTCTFTNTGAVAGVTLTKLWSNAVVGDTTTLTISGAQVSGATGGSSTAPATTTDATATAVAGSTVNVAETLGVTNLGAYTTTLACTSNGAPVTVTGNSFTMPATPVTCTFTNTGSATGVSLTKAWANAVIGDTTTLTISGPQVSNAVGGSSTAPATTINATATAVAGSVVTLAETLGGGNLGAYTTTLACQSGGVLLTVTNNSFTMPGAAVTCQFTNTGTTGGVTLTKVWANAVIGDSTTLTISGAQVSGATGGSSTAPATTTNATATAVTGSTVNLAEALSGLNKGAYTTTLACTSNGAPVTVTNNSFTMPATAVSCTFTNTGTVAGVTLTKVWANAVIGDTTTLAISGAQVSGATGGSSTAPATTTNATATAVSGSTVSVAEALSGLNKGAYTTTLVCTSNGAPVVVVSGSFTMPATAVTCTFTNTGTVAGVTLSKAWVNAVAGDTTTLTISGTQVSGATGGSSTAPATTTDATATAVTGSTVSLAEALSGLNKGAYTTTLACTTNGTPVVVPGNSFTMPATPVVCSFVNTGTVGGVTLTKVWVNAVTGDTTTLTISGAQVSGATGGSSTAPSTTTDATATAVTGSTVTLAEVLGVANKESYTTTLACTSNGAPVTVTNNSFTMPATAVACTFTNTGTTGGVTLTKVWTNSVTGDTTTLTISGAQVSGATGGSSTAPATTTNATATAVTGSTVTLAEALGAANLGVYATTLACTSNGAPVTVTSNSFTMPTTAVNCTFTNTGTTSGVSLTKVWVNAVTGDTTTLTISGTQVSGAVGGSSTAPATTTNATATAAIGSTVNLAEAFGGANLGVYSTTLACTTNGAPVTVTNNSFTMPATSVNCTFTNTEAVTTVTLTKVFTGGIAGNAVSLTISGGSGTAATAGSATVGGATTAATGGVKPGDTLTLAEAFTAGGAATYNTTLSCTNAAGVLTYVAGAVTGTLTIVGADVGKTIACTYTNAQKATLTKSFSPLSFNPGGTTVLTFTITNSPPNNPAQTVSFTDTLPAGLLVSGNGSVVNGCTGGTVVANASTITVTGVQVGASTAVATTCTIQVTVTNAPLQFNASCTGNPPNFTNTASNVTVVNLINGVAPSCVVVNLLRPTVTKSFFPTVINFGGTATLIFVVTNPAGNPALTTVGFGDNLPSGLQFANPPALGGTCLNAVAATVVAGTTVTRTGLSIPAGPSSCTVTVDVTNRAGQANPSCAVNPAAFTNGFGNVTVNNVDNGVTDSCLVVNTLSFGITKTASLTNVTPGAALSFTVVITNNGPSAADGSIVTDPAIPFYAATAVSCTGTTGGATCPAPLTIAALQGAGMTIATFPAGATVTLRIDGTTSLASGSLTNTVTVSPPESIPGVASASASASVGVLLGVIPTLSPGILLLLIVLLSGVAGMVYMRRARP